MKIYTRGGDKGQTSLVGGARVPKTHVRIEAYGTVDELNAWVGKLRDCHETRPWKAELLDVQEKLFTVGSNLALETPGKFDIPTLSEGDVSGLEALIDRVEEGLEPMRNFVLPGGHPAVSSCHIARTVCRRAEREVLRMADQIEVDDIIVKYLNRLSDFLFMFSRKLTSETGSEEIPWKPKKA